MISNLVAGLAPSCLCRRRQSSEDQSAAQRPDTVTGQGVTRQGGRGFEKHWHWHWREADASCHCQTESSEKPEDWSRRHPPAHAGKCGEHATARPRDPTRSGWYAVNVRPEARGVRSVDTHSYEEAC